MGELDKWLDDWQKALDNWMAKPAMAQLILDDVKKKVAEMRREFPLIIYRRGVYSNTSPTEIGDWYEKWLKENSEK